LGHRLKKPIFKDTVTTSKTQNSRNYHTAAYHQEPGSWAMKHYLWNKMESSMTMKRAAALLYTITTGGIAA